MDKNTIRVIFLKGEKETKLYVVGKFMARYGIMRYHVLIKCVKKILADDAYKTQ